MSAIKGTGDIAKFSKIKYKKTKHTQNTLVGLNTTKSSVAYGMVLNAQII